MIKLSKDLLSKMKKSELVDLVMQLQGTIKPAIEPVPDEKTILSKIEEADKKMAQIRASRGQSVERPSQPDYVCINCNSKFKEDNVVYIKDINDPICFNCRRQ